MKNTFNIGDTVRFTKEKIIDALSELSELYDNPSSVTIKWIIGNHKVYRVFNCFQKQYCVVDGDSCEFGEKKVTFISNTLELVSKAEIPIEEEQIKQAPDMKVVNLSKLTVGDKFRLTDKAYREICASLVEGYEEDFDKQKLTHTEYQNHIKTCFTRLRMISSFNGANIIASYSYNGSVKTYTDQDGVEYPESSIVKVEK